MPRRGGNHCHELNESRRPECWNVGADLLATIGGGDHCAEQWNFLGRETRTNDARLGTIYTRDSFPITRSATSGKSVAMHIRHASLSLTLRVFNPYRILVTSTSFSVSPPTRSLARESVNVTLADSVNCRSQ